MSPEVALEVLGLAAPVDARAVRAAYLERLRVTKPDQKPLEFRRLREAYERLQHGYAPPSWHHAEPDEPGAGDAHQVADEAALAAEDDADDELGPEPTAGPDDGDDHDDDDVRVSNVDELLEYVDREVPPGLPRLRALDDAITWRPTDPRLYVRLFDELLDLGLERPATGVLESLAKIDPAAAWQLAVRKLRRHTTTYQLRNPPPGATPEDRLTALEILVDVHRNAGEVESLALRLVGELDASTRAALRPRLITLGLRVAGAGFVEDGQSIVRAALSASTVDSADALAEWSRLDGLQRMLSAALASALHHDDPSFVSDIAERLDDPARERALLAAQSTELMRRYGGLIPERGKRAPAHDGLVIDTRKNQPESSQSFEAVLGALFGVVLMILTRACSGS
ncbi:J domain-containing protein [Myxococcota bacterium]|nr:J domain-containing protein [Myxococcota bacterium]